MSPYEIAREVYEREPCARSFGEDFYRHLYNAYVISTPDLFVMFRPVSSEATDEEIVDSGVLFDPDQADCWHVYLAAGDLSRLIEHVPFPLPYISFERKNNLRRYRFQKFLDRCKNVNSVGHASPSI